jgi:hypothetical protein
MSGSYVGQRPRHLRNPKSAANAEHHIFAGKALTRPSRSPFISFCLSLNASTCPFDILGAADLYVIAANDLLDLTRRTAAVVDEHPLPLAHLSYGRFLFQHNV